MMSYDTGTRFLKQDAIPHMWCPGCGNGIVLSALLRVFAKIGYTEQDTVVVTGIGCSGKTDDYVTTNALHVTHGRALPFASGIKGVRPDLHVVVIMGDGDGVTIGGNHFIHSARRNIDVTAIVVNNFNYGMTGGQFSATTPADYITSTTAYGNPERDFDICALAEAAGANYIARSTIYHGRLLEVSIQEALAKKGFSLVEVFSTCPTHFGKNNKMKTPVEMLRWFKQKGMTKDHYDKLSAPEKCEHILIGKLVDKDAPDFNTRYAEIIETARQN